MPHPALSNGTRRRIPHRQPARVAPRAASHPCIPARWAVRSSGLGVDWERHRRLSK